ncbi:MAG: hypothetical protein HOW97_35330 [Catenulispora sp.]|nr:hypothetical protein [Catenulispora sp.]
MGSQIRMTDAAQRNDIRRAWLDEDTAGLSAARAAKHRLVEQVRRLVDAAFQLDCGDAGYGAEDGIAAVFERRAAARGGGEVGGPEVGGGAERVAGADGVDAAGGSAGADASDTASAVATDRVTADGAVADDGDGDGKASRGSAGDVAGAGETDSDAARAAHFLALAAEAEALADRVSALPRIPRADVDGVDSSRSRRHDALLVERSTINGRGNPLAPPVRMWADGDLIRAEAYFTAPYEGPPGRVHGAWVAACFDEVLGCAQGASGAFGFTGTLTITLRRATPLYTKITYEAGFSHREGRKIHAWGRCYADGQLTAEATGVFVVPVFGGVGHGTK